MGVLSLLLTFPIFFNISLSLARIRPALRGIGTTTRTNGFPVLASSFSRPMLSRKLPDRASTYINVRNIPSVSDIFSQKYDFSPRFHTRTRTVSAATIRRRRVVFFHEDVRQGAARCRFQGSAWWISNRKCVFLQFSFLDIFITEVYNVPEAVFLTLLPTNYIYIKGRQTSSVFKLPSMIFPKLKIVSVLKSILRKNSQYFHLKWSLDTYSCRIRFHKQ